MLHVTCIPLSEVTSDDLIQSLVISDISLDNNLFVPVVTQSNVDVIDDLAKVEDIILNPIQIGDIAPAGPTINEVIMAPEVEKASAHNTVHFFHS